MGLSFSAGIYQTVPIREVIRLSRLAEGLGFETVWLGDSQCLWREVYATLGAVAVSTTRIGLGISVTNPSTRHLTVTAASVYSLDESTDGRIRLGIGRGETSVILVGTRRATLKELDNAVTAIRHLLAGRSVDIDGTQTSLAYAASTPRSVPVYLPGSGPRMLRLAGEIANGVLLTVGADPRYLRAAMGVLEEGARAKGRRPEDIRVVARIPCCVSDEPDARRYVRSHVAMVVLQAKPFALDPEDLAVVERIRGAYEYRQHMAVGAAHADLVPDRLVDKFALAGRPEECADRVRALVKSGIDELNIVLMSPDPAAVLRTFADGVMAQL